MIFSKIALFFLVFFSSLNCFADLYVLEADASWCGPCKVLARQLDEDSEGKDLLLKYRGLIKYDIDRYPNTVKNFGINTVPSYLILSIVEVDNKLKTDVLDRWTPPEENSLESLKKFLKKNLTTKKK